MYSQNLKHLLFLAVQVSPSDLYGAKRLGRNALLLRFYAFFQTHFTMNARGSKFRYLEGPSRSYQFADKGEKECNIRL